MWNTILNAFNSLRSLWSGRVNLTIANAHGWAFTKNGDDITRLYVHGTFVNGSSQPISIVSVCLCAAEDVSLYPEEAPYRILGCGDAWLESTKFPVHLPPFASNILDILFRCPPTTSPLLLLPLVDTLSGQSALEAQLYPHRASPGTYEDTWIAHLRVATSRGDIHLDASMEWRNHKEAMRALYAQSQLPKKS